MRSDVDTLGVSETGSAKTVSTINVRIDDAGSILNVRIQLFSLIVRTGRSVDAEFSHCFCRLQGG